MSENCFICACCGKSKPNTQRILLGTDVLCYACPRSTQPFVTAAASGYTAEMLDKSITAQFVHNAVDKSRRNPTERNAFSGIFAF